MRVTYWNSLVGSREILGEDLTPSAIVSVARDPKRFIDRLREEGARRPLTERLPSLGDDELRPMLDSRTSLRPSFAWAEANIDRLNAALLYSHSAVAVDPFFDLDDHDPSSEAVLGMLHYLAVNAPLVDAGLLFLIPPIKVNRAGWTRGPWPRQRYAHDGPNHVVRWLESQIGLDHRMESDLRPSRNLEDRAFGRNLVLDRMQIANALKGRAHFFLDHHPNLGWSNASQWDEEQFFLGTIGKIELRLLLRRLARSRSRADLRRFVADARIIQFLLREPVPDLRVVSAADLVSIRQGDAFGEFRRSVSRYVSEYGTALSEDRLAIGAAIADELRSSATLLEEEIAASSVLRSLRAGVGSMAFGALAGAVALPALGLRGLGDRFAVSAGSGLAEAGRRLVAAHRKANRLSYVAARASAARAAAEVFGRAD